MTIMMMSWKERREVGKRRGSCGGRGFPIGSVYTRDRQLLRDGEQLDGQSRKQLEV